MKTKLLAILIFISTLGFSQTQKVESIIYKKQYTIAQRDAMSLGVNDRKQIYVVDTGVNELQIWDGDSWETLGGGVTIPTLQQVTEAGASTDQPLSINADITLGNYNSLKISDGTYNSAIARPSSGFTSNRVFRIPDRDGTPSLAATDGTTTVNTGTDGILDLSGLSFNGGSWNHVATSNILMNGFDIEGESGMKIFTDSQSGSTRLTVYDSSISLGSGNDGFGFTDTGSYNFARMSANDQSILMTNEFSASRTEFTGDFWFDSGFRIYANNFTTYADFIEIKKPNGFLGSGITNLTLPIGTSATLPIAFTDGTTTINASENTGVVDLSGLSFVGGSENYVNINNYNVVGDGSDETSEIAAAITAIPEGSTVYFPSGTYATDSPIIISKRLTIIGNGVDTVFKTFTAENEMGVDTGVIKVTSDNVSIYNIAIDGNYTIASGGGVDRNAGLYVDAGVNYTIVKNLTAYNTPRQGLCVVGANGTYENITVYDTARHNISVGDGNNTINAAKNNYFKNITCLGSEDAAFEVNDGCEDIYVDGFNFSGTFSAAPLRVITHDRVGETNKNITFINGTIKSNIGCVQIASASTTEANENIKLSNVDMVGSGFLIDVNQITRGLTLENCSVSSTGTKIRVQGEASKIIIKNLLIKDYTNGAILDIKGTSSVDVVDVSIDKIYFNDDWNGGNAQMLFNYIDGLNIKNVNLSPTTSTTGDCFQIQNSHSVTIESCNVANYTSRLIVLVSSEDVLIDKCFLTDAGGNIIDGSTTTNFTIRKSKLKGSPADGIETSTCTNVIVDNCEITDNNYGIFSTNDTTYKVVNGTTVYENNSTSGLEFDGTNNITIANSTIKENSRHGIRILGGSFVNLNNNQIFNNNISTSGGSGLQLRTDNVAIENIQITNNNIYDDQATATQDYAIDYRVDSGSLTNIIITGNILKDAFNATFTPSATVIIGNNIEY